MGLISVLTVDYKVVCEKAVIVLVCVNVFIGELICCVVVCSVSTIPLFTKCDGVWISWCVKFLVPLRVLGVFMNVEYMLSLVDLSINIVL